MGRNKKLDLQELMEETETLLLEKGYEGFHFKALSEKLSVARSTLYEYYRNKDELITAYMCDLMKRIMKEAYVIDQNKESGIRKLHSLLQLFLKHSQIYSMIQMRPHIKETSSPLVSEHLRELDQSRMQLLVILHSAIEKGKAEGSIRADIQTSLIAGLFFHSVLIPNRSEMPQDQWATMLFDLLENGMKASD